MRTVEEDNPASLVAGQLPRSRTVPATVVITDPDLMVVKKAIDTCGYSGMPIPNARYYEALENGVYLGPTCDCYNCRRANKSARRKFI